MGRPAQTATNSARSDGNQNFTIIGVIGTLGTADLQGTASTLPASIDPLTGAIYVNNIGASGTGGGGTVVTVDHGTINAATAIINSGTINVGTFVNNGGTIGVVQNAGTIAAGANIIGNVGTLIAGTINSATTVLNSGTINVGTFVNNGGTVAVIQNAGTIATGANTIGNVGTLLLGTVKLNPLPATFTITSGGTTSAGTIGTLISAPAVGTTMYITGFHVLQVSGTAETVLSFGLQTSGNQVLAHGSFPAGGGIAEPKTFPSGYGATGTALTWNILSGSGTIDLHVDYFLV